MSRLSDHVVPSATPWVIGMTPKSMRYFVVRFGTRCN